MRCPFTWRNELESFLAGWLIGEEEFLFFWTGRGFYLSKAAP